MKQPATQDDRIWRALGDHVRREMLDELAKAPMTTGDLVRVVGQFQSDESNNLLD